MNSLWYKNAVIYSLDIESYLDTTGNGVGDMKGLKHRLNYLSNLGVNCIWVLPFYDSPNRDNGYDVKDYYQVDRRLGDLGYFAEFMDAAAEEGIRVIVDLVANHTSIEHFWFQEARKDKDSPYRDFYIWLDQKPADDGSHAIFGEKQGNTNWTLDKKAGQFYYHTFYKYQADLNISNPRVQKEIMRIMHFWLKMGVSGFRIDAAPHMVRKKGKVKFDGDPHEVFRKFRKFLHDHKQDAVLLAEVDVEPEKYNAFFGEDDQMHMLLNFYSNNYLFLSLARHKAAPLKKALEKLARIPEHGQLANFARNHDELDLERLTDKEREEVLEAFAPQKRMRIYGRGIRRRLAPMLNNDRRRIQLVYSLVLSLPGTPVFRYGQEIGMGENLDLKERESVRTTMQWSQAMNGGFSKAPEDKVTRHCIREGEFGYKKVNVADQERDPDSLVNWLSRAINYRREIPEFGRGSWETLETGNPGVLGIKYETPGGGLAISVHNFSEKDEEVKLGFDFEETIVEMFADQRYDDRHRKAFTLSAYGFRWFKKIDFV